MTPEELEALCKEAARNLLQRESRPLPAAVVLPASSATQIATLTDFPDDDPARYDLLARFAEERMRPRNAPCYGFVAEATLADDTDVLVVVFGARRQPPRVTAAPIQGGEMVGVFAETEELDRTAMPFLAPLQHAVDAAGPPNVMEP